MQIQQWVAEVRALAEIYSPGATTMVAANTASEGRYAIMKELISRKEELEAPLEEGEKAVGSPVRNKSGGNSRGGRGAGAADGSADGIGGGGGGGKKIIQGMEDIYGDAATLLEELEEEADAVEVEIDTWFDEHLVSSLRIYESDGVFS